MAATKSKAVCHRCCTFTSTGANSEASSTNSGGLSVSADLPSLAPNAPSSDSTLSREGMAAIPVIKQCIQRPYLTILMTTTTSSAFEVIQKRLPTGVIHQVTGKLEIEEALRKLFSDAKVLEAHRIAAKQVYHTLSSGIVENVWNLLDIQILQQALS